MKKLLIQVGLMFGLVIGASAQTHSTQSFLSPGLSIYLTNSATFLTNMASPVDSITTNLGTVVLTNINGTVLTTNNVWNLNPFLDVNIPVDRNASALTVPATNGVIWITIPAAYAGANATNKISLEFVGILGGINGTNFEDTTTTALTLSTSDNTAVKGNAVSGSGTWSWPFAKSAFPGCKGLRLRKVYTVAPVDASSQFVISSINFSSFNP